MDNIQPGQMLGPYRIINQIGRGGMATVYKAYQPSIDRYVAVKVLPSQLAESKEFAKRFHQEARIIANLEHPHILPVFDYGESDGIPYFVMRFLDAGTLKDRMIEGRPLPINEIDKLFTQLAEALSYAHSRGVVHRDLKPANALIDAHGNVFLTDFGIAKLLESASPRLTQTDAILGTPAYISPEQAQANPVDERSDIYSLGIILYEMVTGSVPFTAETPLAVIFKHISDPLPPPSSLKPDVPSAMEQVILKALAKNPQDRFATAGEFTAAWKRALAAAEKETIRPVSERPPAPAAHAIPSAQTQQKAVPHPRAAARSAMPTVWIAGCLVAACALFSLGGLALLASNWQGLVSPGTITATPPSDLPPTDVPPTTTVEVPVSNTEEILIQDDFSARSSNWGTLTDAESSVEYVNGALQVKVFKKDFVVWTTPNDTSYDSVHMEVTVYSSNTDSNTGFGFMCAQQSEDWSYYYLVITPAGEYLIAKATANESDVYLTNHGNWGTSDLIPKRAESYRLGADCSKGALTLYVGGKQIASATDSSYTSGRVGLYTWSSDKSNSADVTFDDFLMKALK